MKTSTPPHVAPAEPHEIQAYGHVIPMPIALDKIARAEAADNLNQLLADAMTLRDMYKKHHWQVSGPHFYPLHLLFDKHYREQEELVDQIAERIMSLGGVCLAMAADVAEVTIVPRPPKGREQAAAQMSRLLAAHSIVIEESRTMARLAARSGDEGTADLLVSDVIRLNELQAWFIASHEFETPVELISEGFVPAGR
jgi:starvation-inducible DNA-binding protein